MFKRYALLLMIVAVLPWRAVSADVKKTAGVYADVAGPYEVATVEYNWMDKCRSRSVPVKIYYPADCNAICPLIIFSHGLGGSREGYGYLGRCWASYGYISAHVQHIGSDVSLIVRGNDKATIKSLGKAVNMHNATERPEDVSFAITEISKLNNEAGLFKGRIDMNEVGVAGHSFGAYTALAVAGQKLGVWFVEKSFTDPRVKAVIALSPPYIKWQSPKREFGSIQIPFMVMTGTLDVSPLGETSVKQRRLPFDCAKSQQRYLVTFIGADHMVFSGRWQNGRFGGTEEDERFQSLIKPATVAFWDAYLRDESKAEAWLRNGGLEKFMDDSAVVEMK